MRLIHFSGRTLFSLSPMHKLAEFATTDEASSTSLLVSQDEKAKLDATNNTRSGSAKSRVSPYVGFLLYAGLFAQHYLHDHCSVLFPSPGLE